MRELKLLFPNKFKRIQKLTLHSTRLMREIKETQKLTLMSFSKLTKVVRKLILHLPKSTRVVQ